jgi:metal-responsive CopG/Arc/MetJ family transcriptional regulator
MGTNKVNFRLPEELVEKTDVVADLTHRNRTEIVKEALRAYFEEIEDDNGIRGTVIECYLNDEIEFETLVTFVGRRDAEAIRSSKRLLDRGEDLARDLADTAGE